MSTELNPKKEAPEDNSSKQNIDTDISSEEKSFIGEMVALSMKGVIIRKGSVSIRMFSIGGGRTIVCYLLQECDDGFIVALPAVLGVTDKVVVADFISPTALVKFFKTGTPMMALPTPSIYYHYLRLSKEKFNTLPGFFVEERRKQVDFLIIQLKQNYNLNETTIGLTNKSTLDTSVEDEDDDSESLIPEGSFYINDKTNKNRH